jgi:O-antigen/teichoic acid export membrane protein
VNSKTIARNTIWYAFESLIGFGTTFITGIAIARVLGPTKMSYFVYVSWIATLVSSLGSVGLPMTTRKYMAEFVGRGDRPTARYIYLRMLLTQAMLAVLVTLGAVIWVFRTSPVEYRAASLMLVLSILPAMTNFISAQANVASENLSANLPGSLSSTVTYFVLTLLAVTLGWGVNGIALAVLAMRVADCVVRLIPTFRRINGWSGGEVHPPADLRARMVRFAVQSVTGMLLTLIVWDRSELFLLKQLNPDIRQISFYSVAISLAERLLLFPTIFAEATGASVMAQYGRDSSRLPAMTAAAARYIALISIPIHLIAIPLAAPVLLVLYGKQYVGALVVASVSPLFCLPKAFLRPIQDLFESVERQKYFLIMSVLASFVDIGVAWMLIPRYGALGACIGSGAAQFTAVALMWGLGIRQYKIELPWGFILKITLFSAAASSAAYAVIRRMAPLPALIVGIMVVFAIFFLLAYIFKVLEQEDSDRFRGLAKSCPPALGRPIHFLLDCFTRRPIPDPTGAV